VGGKTGKDLRDAVGKYVKQDLSDFDFLVFPIGGNDHWLLAIVHNTCNAEVVFIDSSEGCHTPTTVVKRLNRYVVHALIA
jgi:Ulp1 family protease